MRETSKHLTQCKHVGRVQLFRESTQEVVTCLENANKDPILIDIIESYLHGQGTVTMESCVPLQSSYLQMSQSQDRLGWDCFVEGCISVLLLECIHPLFVQWTPQKSLEKWGAQFLKTLLNLTHKQWIFWNADVHYKIDGLTQEQHMEIFSRIQNLMEITLLDLLPCNCHLLKNNFHDLGNVEMIQQQIWIALMESALKAASPATAGQIKPGSMMIFNKRCLSAKPHRSTIHNSQ